MMTYIVAIIYPNPEQFDLLTNISATMVCSACVIFTATNSPPLCGNSEYQPIQDNFSEVIFNTYIYIYISLYLYSLVYLSNSNQ